MNTTTPRLRPHTEDQVIIDGAAYLTHAWVMKASSLECTREEGAERHKAYYRQFVTDQLKDAVAIALGDDGLPTDKQEYPPRPWDLLAEQCFPFYKRLIMQCEYLDPPAGVVCISISSKVCVVRVAADQIMAAKNQKATDSQVVAALKRVADHPNILLSHRQHAGHFRTCYLEADPHMARDKQLELLKEARKILTEAGVAGVTLTHFNNPPYRNKQTGKTEAGHPRHGDPMLEVESVWWAPEKEEKL